jgi:hypothetical protein
MADYIRPTLAAVDFGEECGFDAAMPSRSGKRPRDANQLAKHSVDIATGDAIDRDKEEKLKSPAAVSLGRLGGRKGGKARAANLSPERRSEIARKAAQARYGKKP